MKKARVLVLALTLALGLGLVAVLLAIPQVGLAQPINKGISPAALQAPILDPFIDIWVDTVYNMAPAVAYNSLHDEYLVVWYNDQGGPTRDIYARRVGGDGSLKSWFAVVTGTAQVNWLPDVAYSPAQDQYLVAYTYADPVSDFDVWARRVSWNGGWMSPEFPIHQDSDDQWNAAVAYNSLNDEYLVVYQNTWASGLYDIAAVRVRASDGITQSWRNIATGAGDWRIDPDVAYNGTRNEYLITYRFLAGPSHTSGDILGKVASYDMGTLSSEIGICTDTYDQIAPAVAAGPDEYLVAWSDGIGTEDYDIFARRVSGDGTPQGASGGFEIAGIGNPNLHEDPAVAYGAGYGYLVAWAYDIDPGALFIRDINGRYVMSGQNQAAGNGFAIDGTAYNQHLPAIACGPSGDCLVVEEDEWSPSGSGDYEIRGRFVRLHRLYLPTMLRNFQ